MKVAYVVSMFPCWSETFILNELICHEKSGLDLNILSLKKCREDFCHDEAKHFVAKTIYPVRILNPVLWFSHTWFLLVKPLVCMKIMARLFKEINSIRILIKSLFVYLLCPYFVWKTREINPEHIHAHFATYPALMAWMISKFTGIPFSFTAHAHDIYVDASILKIVHKDAASIVTISEFNKRFVQGKIGSTSSDKVHVIRCGIDLEIFPFTPKQGFIHSEERPIRLLSIGRLSGIKGFPYLIEALAQLKGEGINFKCTIIGDGPLRQELQDRVRNLQIDGHVDFLGARKAEEVQRHLRDSDVFVLACARDKKEGHDGIPVVFMEAMAMGTPVIATRISGIPELVIDGETGYCAEAENSESLADCIRNLLSNSRGLEKIVRQARTTVEKEFNIISNSEALSNLFYTNVEGN